MSEYTVRHLHSNTDFSRPWIYHNSLAADARTWVADTADPAVEAFHKALPDYNETKLHDLNDVASELGLAHVFIKDESTRFGLPAFKILGASWAAHKAICKRLNLPSTSSLDNVRAALQEAETAGNAVRLVTCSEGNWGRACARMSKILGIEATIYVPGFMSEYTRNLLHGEGADVRVLKDGSYDDSIAATRKDSDETGALMVMDTSWEGYTEVPRWVTDGYSTMLTETDRQVATLAHGVKPNTFFVSVGVGSWAHSVVAHYKAADPSNRIVSVEPTAAASLKESLHVGGLTPIATGETIMAGMCCGTISHIAWPVLKSGIHAAVTVTDQESHESVQYLQQMGVNAGPCGAATLAALRKYVADIDTEEKKRMVVVLFSTEGWREYEVPS
ncbi:hypothetical protein AC578_6162 [Pseudocercospora eumusae]|uniref:Tryptophan synthase beta chain-like PALP domain-containing protein n=1 Tax=Pseudocercospora eumusae TaxID=321146 RepID=A0A139H973_9PEZI|nr:hypothetical protein AC578_6162 [Pseudocercospora eumusae]